jgi:5'-deoxynucleotidase YfbR-like HD superfamily hydrolase
MPRSPVRSTESPSPRLRMHVETALKSPETIKACAALALVHEAMELLTELPPPALEALRDAFKEMAETRTGPRGELKKAWLNYTQQALEDARFRERQETFGMYKDSR